jgi:hypothetical protein
VIVIIDNVLIFVYYFVVVDNKYRAKGLIFQIFGREKSKLFLLEIYKNR